MKCKNCSILHYHARWFVRPVQFMHTCPNQTLGKKRVEIPTPSYPILYPVTPLYQSATRQTPRFTPTSNYSFAPPSSPNPATAYTPPTRHSPPSPETSPLWDPPPHSTSPSSHPTPPSSSNSQSSPPYPTPAPAPHPANSKLHTAYSAHRNWS